MKYLQFQYGTDASALRLPQWLWWFSVLSGLGRLLVALFPEFCIWSLCVLEFICCVFELQYLSALRIYCSVYAELGYPPAGGNTRTLLTLLSLLGFYFFYTSSMATYDTLPVYKQSYDLLMAIFTWVSTLPREYKFTLGEHIKDETLLLIRSLYRANSSIEKRKIFINEAREHTETIRLFLRLAKDMKHIWLQKFVEINTSIENISRGLTNWWRKTDATAGQNQSISMSTLSVPLS